jgi:hypothetical protein
MCASGDGLAGVPAHGARSGFFTTLGYLNLSGQNFFTQQNNSRRFSGMYFTLTGEGPPRSGEKGAAAPPPPGCIDGTDLRELVNVGTGKSQNAGAAAVLHEGQVCQSCHLSRGVAAGMVLFRPARQSALRHDRSTSRSCARCSRLLRRRACTPRSLPSRT